MASATGIPQEHPQAIEAREDEPLLGARGQAVQKESDYIFYNLFTGKLVLGSQLCRQLSDDRRDRNGYCGSIWHLDRVSPMSLAQSIDTQ